MQGMCAKNALNMPIKMNDGGKLLPLADEKLIRNKGRREKLQLTMFGLLFAVRQFFTNLI